MITELEFKSLAAQGYNRIPLIAEAFADLETPLSLYLKLAGGAAQQLPARIGGRRRALRPLLLHRPAGAHAAARHAASAPRCVTDGAGRRDPRRQPAGFHRRLPAALQGRAAARAAALLRRPGRLLRLRRGALHRAEAGRTRQDRRHRHARHPAAADRGAGRHRQPVGPAVPDRLRRPGRSPRPISTAKRRLAELGDKLRYSVTAPPVRRGPALCGRARVRQGRLPGRGAPRQGVHRRRRHDAGADRPAPAASATPKAR